MQNKVGKYSLIEQIGSGTSGIVYRAEDPEIGRSVAIKIMKEEYFGQGAIRAQAVERFSSEIRAIGRLSHHNIVSIYDSGITNEGLPYLVMQFVEGRGLDFILRDLGVALAPARALKILKQLGAAIDYAHTQNVVHRDIKPSNILLTKDEHVFIVDFSTALVAGDTLGNGPISPNNTSPNTQVIGTPQFMAPEVIRGETARAATDLYSLGILAFLLFTGNNPFREGSVPETFDAVLRQSAFSFAELNCTLGSKLERVLRRSLAKSPLDRYKTALEFINACEKALSNSSLDTFSQVAPESEIDSESGTGSFGTLGRKVARRGALKNFSTLRVLSLLSILSLVVGALVLGFIQFGLGQDSELIQRFRSRMGLGIEYTASELKAMPNDVLLQVLISELHSKTQQIAIIEAAQRNTEELAHTISTVFLDSETEVRIEAIRAIATMTSVSEGTRNHFFILSLQDPDPFIRSFAAASLAKNKGKKFKELIKKQRAIEKDIMTIRLFDMILSRM